MTSSLDKYGRILIPKRLRELLGLTVDVKLQLRHEGGQIIIEALKKDVIYKEEGDFIFFTGAVEPAKGDDLLKKDRSLRDNKLLGL